MTAGTVRRMGRIGVWHGGMLGASSASRARGFAAEVEELGYGSLWIGEALGKEAFAHAAILLGATRRLVLGTGIANIWARDPSAMRAGAATLAEAYPERFVLGIGVSHRPLVEARGTTYQKPLQQMRTYLEAMRATPYQGPEPAEAPPVVLAALRSKMLRLAADHADGAHPYLTPPEHTARAREVLGEGKLLIPEQSVLLETDPARARELIRREKARYLRLPNYVNNLRTLGFGDDDLADGGSDRLIDALVAWGSVEKVQARVKEHLDAGADHVLLQPIPTDGEDTGIATLRELAPALL